MMLAIILLAILFLVGLINTLYYIPPNKFLVWIQSYFPKISTTHTGLSSKVVEQEEDMEEKKNKKSRASNVSLTYDNGHGKAELERVFATFDKNGDGFITKQELGESLRNIGFFTSENDVGSMVGNLDVNGDGLIDIDEFCELYESIMGKREKAREKEEDGVDDDEEEQELRDAFDVFDGDKDGLISVEELGIVLKSLGLKQGMRIEECKEMIRKVDLDGDGMVSFDEFKMMMKSGSNLLQA